LQFAYLLTALWQGLPVDSSIRRFLQYSDCFYFFLPLFFLKDKKQLTNLLIFIIIASCAYPIYQFHNFSLASKQFMTSSDTVRIVGSQSLCILGIAVVAILLWIRGVSQYVLVMMPILSIALTGHRSGYLALGITLLFLFLWLKQIRKILYFTYITSFFLIVSFTFLNTYYQYDFFRDTLIRASDTFNVANPTTMARFYAIRDNLIIFLKKPLIGIGYNYECIPSLLPDYLKMGPKFEGMVAAEFNVLHPHNFFMWFLSHTGIIGTSLISSIIISLFKKCHGWIHYAKFNLNSIGIFFFCSLLFFILITLMNDNFFSNGYIFWTMSGIIVFSCGRTLESVPQAKNT